MILKPHRGKDADLAELETLLATAPATVKPQIEKELWQVRAGNKGEKESAYYIDFDCGTSIVLNSVDNVGNKTQANPPYVGKKIVVCPLLFDNRAHANHVRVMALPAETFLHRFLLHVLLRGFQRIRHYGLLANRHKAERLTRARAALCLPPAEAVVTQSVEDLAWRVLGVDIQRCPVCHEGRMQQVATLPRARGAPDHG